MGNRRDEMKFTEFDQYSEDLLMAQYKVSNIISHELMKGEVREDFLIDILVSCSEPKPIFVKGTLSDGISDAGQLDIILCRPNCHIRKFGTQSFVEKDDALCVIEVKGNCTGRDIRKAVKTANKIKNLKGEPNSPLLYGIVCYKLDLEMKTIMSRFGYSYDKENDTYFDNASIPTEIEDNWKAIEYLDIDFFMSLEEDKKIFLRKDTNPHGSNRFVRLLKFPLITELFSMIRSLSKSG